MWQGFEHTDSSPHQPHLELPPTSPGPGVLHRHSLGPLAPACAVLEECWSPIKLCLTKDTLEPWTDLTFSPALSLWMCPAIAGCDPDLCTAFLAWPCACLRAMVLPYVGLASWLNLATVSGLALLRCCGAGIGAVRPWLCCPVPYLLPCKELWKEMPFNSVNFH